jgi:hypothetical protein
LRGAFFLSTAHPPSLRHLQLSLTHPNIIHTSEMADKDANKSRGPPPGDLPKPEKLPASLQKIIDKADKEDNFYDELYDGT